MRKPLNSIDWQLQRYNAVTETGEDIALVIEYDIEPYLPETRPSLSDPGSPAEGGCVEYLSATRDGVPFELTFVETADITDWIQRHHDHDYRGDPDAAYEAWRDDEMDADAAAWVESIRQLAAGDSRIGSVQIERKVA